MRLMTHIAEEVCGDICGDITAARPRRGRQWLAVTTLALLFALPGCSVLFVRPPPPTTMWNQVRYPACTSSRAWPVIDTIMTLSLAGQFLSETLSAPARDVVSTQSSTNLLSLSILAAAWGASAWVGYDRTDRCSELHDYLQRWRQRGQPANGGVGYSASPGYPTTAAPPATPAPQAPAPAAPGSDAPPPAGPYPPPAGAGK